ncbi:hypothetical protein ACTG9Q_13315 [Actinokineospora sp. 24-640]
MTGPVEARPVGQGPAVRQETDVEWDVGQVLWTFAGGLGAVAATAAVTWGVALRLRGRHRDLVVGATGRMCAAVGRQPGRLWSLVRDIADVLARQDKSAEVGLSFSDGSTADTALLASAEAVTASAGELWQDDDSEEEFVPWGREMPRVADHPWLAPAVDLLTTTAERCLDRARLVVDQAARFGEPEPRQQSLLVDALDAASAGTDEARALLDAGAVLAALARLAAVDLPVPEDGVPGAAGESDLRAGVNTLAKIALAHRAACDDGVVVSVVFDGEEDA